MTPQVVVDVIVSSFNFVSGRHSRALYHSQQIFMQTRLTGGRQKNIHKQPPSLRIFFLIQLHNERKNVSPGITTLCATGPLLPLPHKPHLQTPPSVRRPEDHFVTGATAPTPDNAIQTACMRNIEFEGEQNLGSDKRLPKSVLLKE